MGMAASQARYLALTARKSNVEFQGQQINQQRTLLAVEQGELTAELNKLKNPTPPSSLDYQYDVYTFVTDDSSGKEQTYIVKLDDITTDEAGVSTLKKVHWSTKEGDYTVDHHAEDIIGKFSGSDPKKYEGLTITDGKGKITEGAVDNLSTGTWEDDEEYNDATAKYQSDLAKYNLEVQKINNKSEQIQLKDRTLELKLRNLDTEQNALQTELESVKKVIEDTIKNVFTTFQSS